MQSSSHAVRTKNDICIFNTIWISCKYELQVAHVNIFSIIKMDYTNDKTAVTCYTLDVRPKNGTGWYISANMIAAKNLNMFFVVKE